MSQDVIQADVQTRDLEISSIQLCRDLQSRVSLDPDVLTDYTQAMCAGDTFPPVTVFTDDQNIWLVDGFHRVQAAMNAGLSTIKAQVRSGSYRDALLFSVSVNATHGLRRSRQDKHIVVRRLLDDAEWRNWSSREIARCCHVSHTFVDNIRSENTKPESHDAERPASQMSHSSKNVTYRTRHGTTATMRLGNRVSRPMRVSTQDAITGTSTTIPTQGIFDRIDGVLARARSAVQAGNTSIAFGLLAQVISLCHQARDQVLSHGGRQ